MTIMTYTIKKYTACVLPDKLDGDDNDKDHDKLEIKPEG